MFLSKLSISFEEKTQSNTWKARLVVTLNSNFVTIPISRWKCFISGALGLLKKLFGLLQVKDVTPLVLSQQYETQESLTDKVFYIPGD